MRAHRQFFCQFTRAQYLDLVATAIGQADRPQGRFVHPRTIVKGIQAFDVDGDIRGRVTGIVETALGDAADQRHLAAFKTDADGTAGAGRLAFATASAGFAVTAGFTLAEPFAAMFSTGTGFEIV